MLRTIVALELIRLTRDSRTRALATVCAVTMAVSVAAAWMRISRNDADKARIAAAERERWLGQGERDPHSAAHYSIYAFKPSPPLQVLDSGIEPFVGQTVWLEAHHQNDMIERPLQDAETFQRAGRADAATLIRELGPLLVFLLAFAGVAQDREHGILRLAMGTARYPLIYIAGKVAAVFLLSSVALLTPAVLGGLAAVLTGAGSLSNGLARLFAWTACVAIYLVLFAAGGVITCLMARTARLGFAILLTLWLGSALIAPRLVSDLAERRRPLPSFQALKLQLEEEAPAYWGFEVARDNRAALLARYGVAQEEDLAVNLRGLELDAAERHSHAVFDRLIGGFYDAVETQDRAFAAFGWMSPAVVFGAVSAAVAGTDFSHHRHFVDVAERYRRDLVNKMNADLIPHPPRDGRRHANDARLWSQVPEFRYASPTIRYAWKAMMPALAGFASWSFVIVGALAVVARLLRP